MAGKAVSQRPTFDDTEAPRPTATTGDPTSMFAPAVKEQLKGRVAFCGPTGSGKTWTALEWAEVLAEGGRIALIDTERGSASLYAHRFTFDTLRWEPPYDPQRLVDVLRVAEGEGYAVVVIDSLSHFWEGEGGTLDVVDAAAHRSGGGNSFAGWKVGTPVQRHMVDTIVGLSCHVLVTMRSKMEYVIEEYEDRGRKKTRPVKLGLAPVQRQGVEYEFTVVGDLDLEHRITITKTRCDVLSDQVVQPGRAQDAAKTFLAWLDDGEPIADRGQVDEIVAALGALPDAARKAAKERFVARFGLPAHLRASQVDAALEFVVEVSAGGGAEAGSGDLGEGSPGPACPVCALEGGHEDGCPEAPGGVT